MADGQLTYQIQFTGVSEAVKQLRQLQNTIKQTSATAKRESAAINAAMRINVSGLGRVRTSLQRDVITPLQQARQVAQASSQSIGRSLGGIARPAQRSSAAVASFKGNLAAMAAGQIVGWLKDAAGAMVSMADAATLMDAKLRLATQGWGDFITAQQDVYRISRETRSEMTSTGVLYGKLATAGKLLDASQAQVARATQTVTTALKVSGASATETTSTVLQLGQALSSGKLNGDEFRSLSENAPRLMRLLADSLGVPIGQLKKMASEGELTSDKLFKALNDKRFTAGLDQELKSIPKTFGDAFTAITNVATQTFGAFNEGGQFSQALYDFADQGSTNMKSIMDEARRAGGEIRDTFVGLKDAFQPFFEGATAVFDALGIKVQSLKEQVAGLLSIVDDVRNAPVRLQNWANDFDNRWFGTNKPMQPLPSNMEGTFRRSFAQSRYNRSRDRVTNMIRDRETDRSFDPTGVSDADLIARLRKAEAGRRARQRGGSGNLRTPPVATEPKGNKSRGLTDEQKAAKKYAEAIQELNDRKNDLALTEKQLELVSAFSAAGLKRDIGLTGEKAEAIRKLVGEIQAARDAKQLADTLKELREANYELTLSEEDRAKVEARRRAGLPIDLKIANDQTKAVDEQAAANYRLAESQRNLEERNRRKESLELDLQGDREELDVRRSETTNPNQGIYQAAEAAIERVRRKRIQILETLRLEAAEHARILGLINQQADDEKQQAKLEDQLEKVQRLSDFLVDLWENPKEAMKRFFAEMLRNLLMNIAKATILKKLMPGGGGDGSLGSIIGNAVGSALGFGGGRAKGGGVDNGKFYLVGERGPELFAPGMSGSIIPNHALGGSGGGAITISMPTEMNIHGASDERTRQQWQRDMNAWQRNTVTLIRSEITKERNRR